MNLSRVFDQVLTVESIVAAAVFVIVVSLLAFAIVRYRGGRRAEASQDTEHPRVEALYAAGLIAVAGILYAYTFHANQRETRSPGRPGVEIAVTGFQWCWRFSYVKPAAADVQADCVNGRYPTLVVPTGEPIRITTRSSDVIHAFWMPHFHYKIDAFPAHTNAFEITIPTPGSWTGHCAEFCGPGHPTMLFTLRAVPASQFTQWLSAR